ncbi:MAG: YlxR family protein [Cyanobacteria bacterium P01_F01_bin.53]
MAEKNHRLCVSCRKTVHRDQLWRIVRNHENHQVQLDEGMGRSAYICPNQHCLSAAQKKNRLGRVLRTNVPPEIYQALEQRLGHPTRKSSKEETSAEATAGNTTTADTD